MDVGYADEDPPVYQSENDSKRLARGGSSVTVSSLYSSSASVDSTKPAQKSGMLTAQKTGMLNSGTIAEEETEEHQRLYSALLAPGAQLGWPSHRILLFKIVHSDLFELIVDASIILNLCTIVYQADYLAQCYPDYYNNLHKCPYNMSTIGWVRNVNLFLLVWYSLEGLVRLYTDRSLFFKSRWNCLDALIILINWSTELAGASLNLAFLRFLRLVRLARAVRVLLHSRELMLLVSGVMSSVRAIFYGSLMLFMMLIMYSILIVEWLHPMNSQIEYFGCSECTFAFRSVWRSVLTLFKELIAGQTWIISFPLVEQNWFVAPFMIFIVVSTILGVMNLILAVIVERASEAHARDVADMAQQKVKEQRNVKADLLHMCRAMDKDNSGTVSISELRDAFAESPKFRNMLTLLEVREPDIEMIFKVLDRDGSGDLDYTEFCDSLVQLESRDSRLLLALMRLNVEEICLSVRKLEGNVKNILHKNHLQFHDIRHQIRGISHSAQTDHKDILDSTSYANSGMLRHGLHDVQENQPIRKFAHLQKSQLEEAFSASWNDLEHMKEDLGAFQKVQRELMVMSQKLVSELFEHSHNLGKYETFMSQSSTHSNISTDDIVDCLQTELPLDMASLGSLRCHMSEHLQTLSQHLGTSRQTVGANISLPNMDNEHGRRAPCVPEESHVDKVPCGPIIQSIGSNETLSV